MRTWKGVLNFPSFRRRQNLEDTAVFTQSENLRDADAAISPLTPVYFTARLRGIARYNNTPNQVHWPRRRRAPEVTILAAALTVAAVLKQSWFFLRNFVFFLPTSFTKFQISSRKIHIFIQMGKFEKKNLLFFVAGIHVCSLKTRGNGHDKRQLARPCSSASSRLEQWWIIIIHNEG